MSISFNGRLLTIGEVSENLSVSRSTVYRLLGSQRIEAFKIGKAVRIPEAAVEQLIAEAPRAKIAPTLR